MPRSGAGRAGAGGGSGSDSDDLDDDIIIAEFREAGELGIVLGPRDDHRALCIKQLLPGGQAARLRIGLTVGTCASLLLCSRPRPPPLSRALLRSGWTTGCELLAVQDVHLNPKRGGAAQA